MGRSYASIFSSQFSILILHFPSRYQDRTRSVPLREVGAGRECLVTGTIVKTDLAYGRRRSLTATIQDGTGYLTLRLFHFSARQRDTMQTGLWIRCFGEARMGPTGLEMIHPDYRLYSGEPPPPVEPPVDLKHLHFDDHLLFLMPPNLWRRSVMKFLRYLER